MRKVCHDCPTCGGRLVTLPVLQDGLGAKGVAALTQAVRAAAQRGCRCPTCGNAMGLLKVEVAGRKVEIDVCEKCLSIWCDRGEFEQLVPADKPKPGEAPLRELAARASPEVRERLAQEMLERMPENVRVTDISLGDVVLDVVRLVVGAPTLWRKVRPVTPIFAVLLTLALPVGQLLAFSAWHGPMLVNFQRCFWGLDEAMMKAGGFELAASVRSLFTFPFLQINGRFAISMAFMLYPVFAIVERKAGHVRFVLLLASLWLTAIVAHSVQIVWDLQREAYLCGIVPIALGVVAFVRKAYPDLRWQWTKGCDLMGIYLFVVAMVLLLHQFFGVMTHEAFSFAILALAGCVAFGGWLGGRRKTAQEAA